MSDRYGYTRARQCSICQKTSGGRRLASAKDAISAREWRRRRRREGWGRLKGLGERRELPQRGPGRSPSRKRIFSIFQSHRGPPAER